MYWCHNCRLRFSARPGCVNCPRCHSLALQEDSGPGCPSRFEPYMVRPSLLSRLPQPPPPQLDLSQFDGPVRIRMETTLLRSVSHPERIRVIREYYVIHDSEKHKKNPVDKQKLLTLEKTMELKGCAICQDDHTDSGIILPCKHAFHEKCIDPWFSEANTCPCCRLTV